VRRENARCELKNKLINMPRKKGSTDAQPRQRWQETKEEKEKKVHFCLLMGIPIPFLPYHGIEEAKLFLKLMLTLPGAFDAEKMAIKRCKHVDGVNFSPKLPPLP
jgi:hypothetical protein